MENVFIDTSFFIRHNYLEGPLVKSVLELAKNKIIKIYVSEIVVRELICNFVDDFEQAKQQLITKKFSSLLNSSLKESLLNLRNSEDLEKEFVNNIKQTFLIYGIEILPLHHANYVQVVNDYFTKKAPFTGKKKHEFPDAINLSIIRIFFNNKGENCIFCSYDNDFAELEDQRIQVIEKRDIEPYFSEKYQVLISRQSEIIKVIQSTVDTNSNNFIRLINKYLHDFPFDDESFYLRFDYKMAFHDFINYDITDYSHDVTFNDQTGVYLSFKSTGTFVFDFSVATGNVLEPYRPYTCILSNFSIVTQFQVYLANGENKSTEFKINSINNDDELTFFGVDTFKIMPQF